MRLSRSARRKRLAARQPVTTHAAHHLQLMICILDSPSISRAGSEGEGPALAQSADSQLRVRVQEGRAIRRPKGCIKLAIQTRIHAQAKSSLPDWDL